MKKKGFKFGFWEYIIFIFIYACLNQAFGYYIGKVNGQIEAIKGNIKYEQVIKTKYRNDKIVKQDTIYIKIK